MCADRQQLAEDLVQIAQLALSRGLALRREEREMIESILVRARAVMGGEKDDPVNELKIECTRLGIRVNGDRISLRDASRLLGLSYSYLRGLDIGTRHGRGRPGFVQLYEVARYRHGEIASNNYRNPNR